MLWRLIQLQQSRIELGSMVLEGSVPIKDALAKEWLFIPTLLLLFMLAIYQRRRQPA